MAFNPQAFLDFPEFILKNNFSLRKGRRKRCENSNLTFYYFHRKFRQNLARTKIRVRKAFHIVLDSKENGLTVSKL